jgi:acylphosphatase
MLTQAKIYVIGDVIGVGFRAWTKIQAKILGVTGWVRNEHNRPEVFGQGGGVEATIQGEEEKVQKMIDILSIGSPISHVQDTKIFFSDPKDIFEGFEIRK